MIIIIHRRFWRQTHTSFIWFVFYNNKFEITTSTSSFFLTKITILKKKDGNSSKLTFDYRFWIRLWRFVFKIFVWSWILIKFWKSYISLNILKSCDPSFWTDFTSTLKILLVFYIFPNTTLIFFKKRFKFRLQNLWSSKIHVFLVVLEILLFIKFLVLLSRLSIDYIINQSFFGSLIHSFFHDFFM